VQHALVTHGVNVRPQKPRFESCPPRGIVTSGTHWLPPATRRRSTTERRRLSAVRVEVDFNQTLDAARLRMYAAQDTVQALKAAGKPYRKEAQASRAARAEWLALSGGLETRSITVDQGSAVNAVKAV
jgi:hypothetical protein